MEENVPSINTSCIDIQWVAPSTFLVLDIEDIIRLRELWHVVPSPIGSDSSFTYQNSRLKPPASLPVEAIFALLSVTTNGENVFWSRNRETDDIDDSEGEPVRILFSGSQNFSDWADEPQYRSVKLEDSDRTLAQSPAIRLVTLRSNNWFPTSTDVAVRYLTAISDNQREQVEFVAFELEAKEREMAERICRGRVAKRKKTAELDSALSKTAKMGPGRVEEIVPDEYCNLSEDRGGLVNNDLKKEISNAAMEVDSAEYDVNVGSNHRESSCYKNFGDDDIRSDDVSVCDSTAFSKSLVDNSDENGNAGTRSQTAENKHHAIGKTVLLEVHTATGSAPKVERSRAKLLRVKDKDIEQTIVSQYEIDNVIEELALKRKSSMDQSHVVEEENFVVHQAMETQMYNDPLYMNLTMAGFAKILSGEVACEESSEITVRSKEAPNNHFHDMNVSKEVYLRCLIYRDLWARGFYITNGLKFGCDFLAYPGDPLLFHASYMVQCLTGFRGEDDLDTSSRAMNRVATQVNKGVVLAYAESTSTDCGAVRDVFESCKIKYHICDRFRQTDEDFS